MIRGMTVPEIAAEHGRPEKTIRHWIRAYDWPQPTGTRPTGGRHADEYDPGEVAAAVAAILRVTAGEGDAGELLDAREAAAEAGISYATVRADISRGRWPEADHAEPDGTRYWKRSTVRAVMAARRPHKGRHAG
jgi:uncharacterized protein YjcR